MVAPGLFVAVLVLVLGVVAQPLVELVEPAARALLDPVVYLEVVSSA
jgi:formate hydrogenlyase subunit 3/multisubunit Na+/H+ antiporter MnhD subunit